MSEVVVKRMTVAEFLRWEDGTDTRYELLAGQPVAMAPPAVAHGILALRLGARIDAALRSRPMITRAVPTRAFAPNFSTDTQLG